jgi:DNA-binding NarL/FixJ family response regulator
MGLNKFTDHHNQTTVYFPSSPSDPLTNRETEILELVVEGLSNAEIGERLFLSSQTVKKYLSNVLQKLHLNNRVQAAVYALREGLVE